MGTILEETDLNGKEVAMEDAPVVIPESDEVVEQRIRDLADYVEYKFPQLYHHPPVADGEDANEPLVVNLTKGSVIPVIQELDSEFNTWHRYSMLLHLAYLVSDKMDPLMGDLVAQFLDDEGIDDVDEEAGTLEVIWASVLPLFDGELKPVCEAARFAITTLMSFTLMENDADSEVYYGIIESIGPAIPLFFGMLGFYAISMYINIVKNGSFPKVVYSLNDDNT